MNKKMGGALLACAVGFAVLACASTKSDAYKDIDHAVGQHNFEHGVAAIIKGQDSKKPIYPEKNSISLFLDKGLLEHYAQNYDSSSQDLQEAERLIEEAFTKSISEGVASYIANDNAKEYPGEDFEDIYLNIFNALNYYNAGNTEGALVEIRKLTLSNGKLDMLSRKYGDADEKAAGSALTDLRKIGFDATPDLPPRQSSNFSNSALARYLGALFYQGSGNADSARIEFAQTKTAFEANSKVYNFPLPGAVAAAQNVPAGKARLNIVSFTGLSPIKEEQIFNQKFPFFNNIALQNPQFKLPVLVQRPSHIDKVEITIGHEKFDLELIENMGAAIEETFNARFSRVFFKTYIRTMLKYAALDIAAKEAADRADNTIVSIAAVAAALVGKKVFDETESADIRMSRYLPDKAYVGGINLDPGTYNITVHYYSGGRVVAQDERDGVVVKANGLNLVETISLK